MSLNVMNLIGFCLANRFFILCVVGMQLVACVNYTQQTDEMRSEYRAGRYDLAQEKLENSDLKDSSRNRLLFLLEGGSIADRKGDLQKSRSKWLQAVRVADELYKQSISDTALSFVYNDSSQAYAGEDYERVSIHTMLALSFLGSKDFQGAMVEARSINQKLSTINAENGNDSPNRYVEDAMARMLSGILYEKNREWDSACIDYQKAYDTYRGVYKSEFNTNPPKHLIKAMLRLFPTRGRKPQADELAKVYPELSKEVKSETTKNYGELVVVHEAGMIAEKIAQEFVLPIGKQVVRFSFPTIPKYRLSFMVGETGVEVADWSRAAEQVQDMNYIAEKTLDDRRGRLIAKSAARLLAKGQLTEQAYQKFGVVGGLAANIYSVVTETADTRSWTLLPAKFLITRIQLPSGKHKVKIKTDGRLMRVAEVDIDSDKIEILRDRI